METRRASRARARSTPSPCSRSRPGCGEGSRPGRAGSGRARTRRPSAGASRDRAVASPSPFIAQYCAIDYVYGDSRLSSFRDTLLCSDSQVRAEPACRTPGRDAQEDRGGHGRPAYERRPRTDDHLRHRRAGGRAAPHGLRALSRRAHAFRCVLCALGRSPSLPGRCSLDRRRGSEAPPAGGSGCRLRMVRTGRGRPGDLQARLRSPRDDGCSSSSDESEGSSRSGTGRGWLVAAQAGARGDRARPRARDLALAGPTPRPDAQAGSRRDAAIRLQRLASSLRSMATAEPDSAQERNPLARKSARAKIVGRLTDSGIEVKPVYTADDLPPGALELPGEHPFTRGPYSDHVPRPPVDDPPVRGVRLRRGDERALPLSPRAGPDRALGRLRPAHAARLRLGRPARRGRGRAHRRGDRLDRRHGGAARGNTARRGVDLDDDQRPRRASSPPLRARGGGPGRRRETACRARSRTTS